MFPWVCLAPGFRPLVLMGRTVINLFYEDSTVRTLLYSRAAIWALVAPWATRVTSSRAGRHLQGFVAFFLGGIAILATSKAVDPLIGTNLEILSEAALDTGTNMPS